MRQQRVAEMARARVRGYAPRRRGARIRRINRRLMARQRRAKLMAAISSRDTAPVRSEVNLQGIDDDEVQYRVWVHASSSEAEASRKDRGYLGPVTAPVVEYAEGSDIYQGKLHSALRPGGVKVGGTYSKTIELKAVPGHVRMPDMEAEIQAAAPKAQSSERWCKVCKRLREPHWHPFGWLPDIAETPKAEFDPKPIQDRLAKQRAREALPIGRKWWFEVWCQRMERQYSGREHLLPIEVIQHRWDHPPESRS